MRVRKDSLPPGARVTHFHGYAPAVVLCLLLLTLAAGCGDYVPNHDIIVLKLGPDGSQSWSRTPDSGFDDTAGDILEARDGTLVVGAANGSRRYGGPVPELVLLGADGSVLAEKPCPPLAGEITGLARSPDGTLWATTYDGNVGRFSPGGDLLGMTSTGLTGVWSLAAVPDGGVLAAGQEQTMYPAGSVPVYDANGTVSTRAPIPAESVVTPGCRVTILNASDRRISVTECVAPSGSAFQAAATLMDRNGSIVWIRGYGASGLESFWSAAAAPGGSGYFLSAFSHAAPPGGEPVNHRYAVFVHGDGRAGWITDLGGANLSFPSPWAIRDGQVRLIVPEEHPGPDNNIMIRPEAVELDIGGNVTGRTAIPSSRIITPTADGGYFSAGFPDPAYGLTDMTSTSGGKKELRIMKFSADGTQEWHRSVGDGTPDTVVKVIQTSDGGYVLLLLRQNPV